MQQFTAEQIEKIKSIVNDTILNTIDGINSTIQTSIEIIIGLITIIIGFWVYMAYNKKQVIEEITFNIENKFIAERQRFESIAEEKINEYLKIYIEQLKNQIHKEEYLRNLMIYNIYKILSSEIKLNGENNINEIFSKHSDRLFTISQLTSGNITNIIKALKKLNRKNSTYEPIIVDYAFKAYLSTHLILNLK